MAVRLRIKQGATFNSIISLIQKDIDGVESAVNLTGCSIRAQIRTSPADYRTHIHANMSTANGKIVITNASLGKMRFNVPHTETADWKFDKAWLEFEITYSDGEVRNHDPIECVLIREYTR